MTMVDQIQQEVVTLPESLQAEVLHFVEFLVHKAKLANQMEADDLTITAWSETSLAMAMRDMEEDDEPEYTLADLKGTF